MSANPAVDGGVAGKSLGRALVTGASGGIGTAVCLMLAACGYEVVGVNRSRGPLAALSEHADRQGYRMLTHGCDVTDERAVARLASELGEVAVVVHSAGAASGASVAKESLANWEAMLRANATSAFLVAREFLPAMVRNNAGRIVMIASSLSHVGEAYTASYTAAKHAVLGLARVIAAEIAGTGVTCNCVCPTYVRTPMTDASIATIAARLGKPADEAEALLARRSALGRLVEPDEVAAAVLSFVDHRAGAVNGQSLVLDGGALQH